MSEQRLQIDDAGRRTVFIQNLGQYNDVEKHRHITNIVTLSCPALALERDVFVQIVFMVVNVVMHNNTCG